jgi:S-adenosylmethionine-diacylglycerol 3-amino-3-carboxypropyl transferase
MTACLPPAPRSLKATAHDYLFSQLHDSQLIYNCAWEDPRIDRQLLQLTPESQVVMITSAGCNALDYLLDEPAAVFAVDMNYRQNSVLELKKALLRRADHEALWQLFGEGATSERKAILGGIEECLPHYARAFWQRQQGLFDPEGLRGSFYYRCTAGSVAWAVTRALLHRPGGGRALCLVDALLRSHSGIEQAAIYAALEQELWTGPMRWMVQQPWLMGMLGVPRAQMQLMEARYAGGILGFIQDRLRHTLGVVSMADNYFWRVYLTGHYTHSCCPEYLKAANTSVLADRVDRIRTVTGTVSSFLREHPGAYSHYVLLDHQDWLAAHHPAALEEEWELICANSRPGTRILMRSAAEQVDFIPAHIRQRLRPDLQRAAELHLRDRVGTYASVHLFTLE